MRRCLPLVMVFSACAAPLKVAGPERVVRIERPAKGLAMCVALQEHTTRPGWNGVAEWSAPPWNYAIASLVLRRDDGLVVVDPAFGTALPDDWARTPLLFREGVIGPLAAKRTLVSVLADAGLEPRQVTHALLTHAHWDHTGALPDLPKAAVHLSRGELAWAWPFTHRFEGGTMPMHLKLAGKRLRPFDFDGPPVEGFAASHDLFGDGSVVAVPMPGHTPGSVAYLVRLLDGRTAFLVGDTAWMTRGIEVPEHKSLALDSDRAQVADALGVLHAFLAHRPTCW